MGCGRIASAPAAIGLVTWCDHAPHPISAGSPTGVPPRSNPDGRTATPGCFGQSRPRSSRSNDHVEPPFHQRRRWRHPTRHRGRDPRRRSRAAPARATRAGGDFPAHHSKGPVRPLHCAGFRNCAVAALPRLSPPLATRADATSASARCLLHPVPQGVHELMRDPDPDTGDASACAGLLSASLDAVRVLIAAPGVQTLLVMLLSDCPSHQSVGPFSAARSPHQG